LLVSLGYLISSLGLLELEFPEPELESLRWDISLSSRPLALLFGDYGFSGFTLENLSFTHFPKLVQKTT